ncbi:MAG: hypothetical protein IKV96_02330, partial [Firmicutes bacterium]|nr:hypothetical protein [Bacillota bacterium]
LVNWVASIFTFNVDLYLFQVLISIISMYFHFQILTDIAGISMKYDTPEYGLLLKLRTVEVILMTAVALQTYGETYLSARYTTAFDLSSRLGLSVDFYQLVVGVMLFVTFAVTIWLCKLLFKLKKSLMRKFYIVDGRAEDDLIYEYLSWNKSGWNPDQVPSPAEEPLIDEYGVYDPEAPDFFDEKE